MIHDRKSVMIRSVFKSRYTDSSDFLSGNPFVLGKPSRVNGGVSRFWSVCILTRRGWFHTVAVDAEVFC